MFCVCYLPVFRKGRRPPAIEGREINESPPGLKTGGLNFRLVAGKRFETSVLYEATVTPNLQRPC